MPIQFPTPSMLSLDSKLQSMKNNHQIHKPASVSITIMMSSLCPSTSLKSPKTLYPAPLGVTLTHPAFHCFCPCPKAAKTPNSRSTLPPPLHTRLCSAAQAEPTLKCPVRCAFTPYNSCTHLDFD